MDELVASLRRERATRALIPLFFVSGATGLIYQTIWARELQLVFGTSTFAIATVLSGFMAGLAIGGFLMGRIADRVRQPLKWYGWFEIGIGVYAVLYPLVIAALTPLYLWIWKELEPSPVFFGMVQYLLVGVALLIPTSFMGATLPILARFATERLGAAGDRVGTLYSVNTAGAVFGTWFAGFHLLPWLGLWTTTWVAALSNVILGVAALVLSGWTGGMSRVKVADDLGERSFQPAMVSVAWCVGLAGFASLVYEVAWFRLLGLMLGASVYAFSVMLFAFLVGIAIGGKVGGPMADKVLRRSGVGGVLRMLALLQVLVAVSSYVLMYAYQELPFWYVYLFDLIDAENTASGIWLVSLLLSGLVMLPPAVLMGAVFPFAVRAVVGKSGRLGGPVGQVYAANTAGGMLGAALAGFVLLPMFRVQGTIFIAAAANLLAAGVVLSGRGMSDLTPKRALRLVGVGAGAVLMVVMIGRRPPWDPLLMTAGMYKYVTSMSDHSREGIRSYAVDQYELLYYKEGLSSVVTVARNIESENIWLANNGKVDASTSVDMPTQVLVSLLPMQFVDDPADVLVIGLASGITAGAVTLIDDVERLDVVELEPAILAATQFFVEYNHDLLEDPRTRIIVNDGRNHVLLTPEATYDVIVSEPSNPWLTGVSNLFTAEFFELGRSRLKPGGVWAQWVQTYGMDTDDLRTLLATFSQTYPFVTMYATAEGSDLVLIGAEHEIHPTLETAERLFETWPAVAREMRLVGMRTPIDVVALFQMEREQILEGVHGASVNTDDNMLIEYSAPLNLHRSTQDENVEFLEEHAVIPFGLLDDDLLMTLDLARSYYALEDWRRAFRAIATVAIQLDMQDPLRLSLIEEAEEWYAEMVDSLGYDKDVIDDIVQLQGG